MPYSVSQDGLSNMMVTETGEDEAQMTESLASDLVKDGASLIANQRLSNLRS